MNKNIIIVVLIAIVLVIVGAIFLTQANGNVDTQINFISSNALKTGDNVTVELKDANGNVLQNEKLIITYVKDGEKLNFTVTTDSNGRGYLTLGAEEQGSHEVSVTFEGRDKYNPSNATQTITIVESSSDSNSSSENSQQSTASTASTNTTSNSQSNLNYDEDLNLHYDDNGVIKGGQNDGESYEYIKNNPPSVVNGSLE